MQNTNSKSYHVAIDINELPDAQLRIVYQGLTGQEWTGDQRADLLFEIHEASAATLAADALEVEGLLHDCTDRDKRRAPTLGEKRRRKAARSRR